jgi:hypothetical protein
MGRLFESIAWIVATRFFLIVFVKIGVILESGIFDEVGAIR